MTLSRTGPMWTDRVLQLTAEIRQSMFSLVTELVNEQAWSWDEAINYVSDAADENITYFEAHWGSDAPEVFKRVPTL